MAPAPPPGIAPWPVLAATEAKRLGSLCARLPPRWTRTPRRRRFLFLALAAPGFVAVFATPLHRNLLVLVAGFLLFAAAAIFRRRTEWVFAHAEAAAVWPTPLNPRSKETAPDA